MDDICSIPSPKSGTPFHYPEECLNLNDNPTEDGEGLGTTPLSSKENHHLTEDDKTLESSCNGRFIKVSQQAAAAISISYLCVLTKLSMIVNSMRISYLPANIEPSSGAMITSPDAKLLGMCTH